VPTDSPTLTPDSLEDPALAARLRGGDPAALELVFRQMHEPLVAFGSRYLGDRARAEEQVQELFFTLWNTRERLAFSGSLRSYLFAAMRNRALNVRRRDAVEQDWADDEAQESVRLLHRQPETPASLLEADALHQAVNDAFDRLPERCRLAMHLRWREGMSYAEIAEVLGIGVKGVENQLARGLKAVRAMVGAT
jgi:RNA polymerase sigma-70 factor (ECF subfamily)